MMQLWPTQLWLWFNHHKWSKLHRHYWLDLISAPTIFKFPFRPLHPLLHCVGAHYSIVTKLSQLRLTIFGIHKELKMGKDFDFVCVSDSLILHLYSSHPITRPAKSSIKTAPNRPIPSPPNVRKIKTRMQPPLRQPAHQITTIRKVKRNQSSSFLSSRTK